VRDSWRYTGARQVGVEQPGSLILGARRYVPVSVERDADVGVAMKAEAPLR